MLFIGSKTLNDAHALNSSSIHSSNESTEFSNCNDRLSFRSENNCTRTQIILEIQSIEDQSEYISEIHEEEEDDNDDNDNDKDLNTVYRQFKSPFGCQSLTCARVSAVSVC